MPSPSERVLDFDDEPGVVGVLLRPFKQRPLDSIAAVAAAATIIAIAVNALALQNGTHPAPIFASPVVDEETPASLAPLPPQRQSPAAPVARGPDVTGSVDASQADILRDVQSELARLGRYDGPIDGLYGPKTEFAIREYERAAGRNPTGKASPDVLETLKAARLPSAAPVASTRTTTTTATSAAPAADSSKRILAIQRVLAEQGYGPVKLDGVVGEETKAAIFRFEIHRDLPPSGELSPRVIRELSAISGVPLQ